VAEPQTPRTVAEPRTPRTVAESQTPRTVAEPEMGPTHELPRMPDTTPRSRVNHTPGGRVNDDVEPALIEGRVQLGLSRDNGAHAVTSSRAAMCCKAPTRSGVNVTPDLVRIVGDSPKIRKSFRVT